MDATRRQEAMDTSRPSDPVEVPMSSRRILRTSTDSGFGSFGAPFPGAPSRFSTPGTSASSSRSNGSVNTWSMGPTRAIATQTSRVDDDHAFAFDVDDAVFENVGGSDALRLPSALLPDVVPRNVSDHFNNNNSHNRNSNGHAHGRGQDHGNGLGRVGRAHSVTLPLPPNFDDVMSQRARDMGRTLRRLSKEFDHAGPVNQGCQQRRATADGVYNEQEGGIWQMVRPWIASPPPPPPTRPNLDNNNRTRPNRLPLMRIRSQSESDAEPPTPTFDNGRR